MSNWGRRIYHIYPVESITSRTPFVLVQKPVVNHEKAERTGRRRFVSHKLQFTSVTSELSSRSKKVSCVEPGFDMVSSFPTSFFPCDVSFPDPDPELLVRLNMSLEMSFNKTNKHWACLLCFNTSRNALQKSLQLLPGGGAKIWLGTCRRTLTPNINNW